MLLNFDGVTIAAVAGRILARLSLLHLPPCIWVAINWVDLAETEPSALVSAPVPEVGDGFAARSYGHDEDRFFRTLAWIEWGGPNLSCGHYRACVMHDGGWWAVDDHRAVELFARLKALETSSGLLPTGC
jgi:hypothetical protein